MNNEQENRIIGIQADIDDELLEEAIAAVVKEETVSVTMLQRRFRIGHNKAARMMDTLESMGIVAPTDGSKPRKVLMTEARR